MDLAGASAKTLSKREFAITAQPVRRRDVIGVAFPRDVNAGDEARVVSPELRVPVNITLQVRCSKSL